MTIGLEEVCLGKFGSRVDTWFNGKWQIFKMQDGKYAARWYNSYFTIFAEDERQLMKKVKETVWGERWNANKQ